MSGLDVAVVFACWLIPPVLLVVAVVKKRNRARAWRREDVLLAQLRKR